MKNNINISNYELYAIDFIENNLSEDLKLDFEDFLNQNPSIKEEMNILDINVCSTDEIIFDNKHLLKKSPIEGISYIEYLMISDIEGVISKNEKTELTDIILNDTETKKNYELFKKTKLSNISIPYMHKNELKRSNIITYKKILYATIPAAAMLVLFFGINISTFKTQKAIACKNNSEVKFNREIQHKENLNNDLINKETNYIVNNKKVIEKNNFDENIIEENIYTPVIAYNELDITEKTFDTKLSNIETICYSENYLIQTDNVYIANNTSKPVNILNKVKKAKAQDLVDFVVDKYNTMTESELTVKVDVDKSSKCVGIEVNDKDYNICLR